MALTGTFTGTGQSSSIRVTTKFAVSLSGFGTATVQIERSFDDGNTWLVVESHSSDMETIGEEALQTDTLYRFNCTAYTSGTIAYAIH